MHRLPPLCAALALVAACAAQQTATDTPTDTPTDDRATANASDTSGAPEAPPTPPLRQDDPPEPGPVTSVPDPSEVGSGGNADEDEQPVDLQFDVRVPMRDGVTLSAHIYRPADQDAPLPALFVKTPYNATGYHGYGMYFARRGYVVALVDARGRGNSGGDFRPFEDDGRDGHDVVEWLAEQSWCNGKVGSFGGSYDGFGQWATIKHAPPHLSTIAPVASVGPGVDFPMWNGISYPYVMRWLTLVSARTINGRIFVDEELWAPAYLDAANGEIAFRELDRRVGNPSDTFQKWQKHPSLDGFWRALMPNPEEMARIDIPILTVTGHYDDDQPGALHYYLGHMKHGSERAKNQHHLVIGPWDHGGTRYPKTRFGKLRVGAQSVLDMMGLHRQWYDWTLKGKERPEFLAKRVAYYVTGAEDWRHADDLEAATSDELVFHLGSNGRAHDVVHSGHLTEEAPSDAGADLYRVDPLDEAINTHDTSTGAEVPITNRPDATPPTGTGLVYHTAPFDEATEIAGTPRLEMYASMDVPDTDLSLRLYEVRADGQTILLSNTVLRARYRNGTTGELVPEGEIVHYVIDDFQYFAREIPAGSRLRLVVSPPIGASWQRNFQSGGVIADETAEDARTATIEVHHGPGHPSRLVLGVVRTEPE